MTIFFHPIDSLAQAAQETVRETLKSHNDEIKNIKDNFDKDIKLLNEKYDVNEKAYIMLYEGVNNQFQNLNILIGLVGLFLTLGGICISWYTSNKLKEIREIKYIIQDLKGEIDETDAYIRGNSILLYERIKRDEKITKLNRLLEVPEDIGNLFFYFASTKLEKEDYIYFRDAFRKVPTLRAYQLLLTQHFSYESLSDPLMRSIFIEGLNSFNLNANTMFDPDIKSFFDGFFHYIKDSGFTEDNEKLIKKVFNIYFMHIRPLKPASDSILKENLEKYSLGDKFIEIVKEDYGGESEFKTWLDSLYE